MVWSTVIKESVRKLAESFGGVKPLIVVGLIFFLGAWFIQNRVTGFISDALPEHSTEEEVRYNEVSLEELNQTGLYCGATSVGAVTFEVSESHKLGGLNLPHWLAGETVWLDAQGDLDACVNFDEATFTYEPVQNVLVAYLPEPTVNRPRIPAESIRISQSQGMVNRMANFWEHSENMTGQVLVMAENEVASELGPQAVGLARVKTDEFIKDFAGINGVESVEIYWIPAEKAEINVRGQS